MSRKTNNTGRTRKVRFVQLSFWLMDSLAWQSLSMNARCLYIELKRRFNGTNNGNISLSHREAARLLNLTTKPVTKAFKELEEKGFVYPAIKGSFDWKVNAKGSGRATRWLLTEHPQNFPEEALTATKDFMKWKSEKKNSRSDKIPPLVGDCTTIKPSMVGKCTTNGSQISHHNDKEPSSMVGECTTVSNIPSSPSKARASGSPKEQAKPSAVGVENTSHNKLTETGFEIFEALAERALQMADAAIAERKAA
ncbi:MAG: hypothetical protein AAGF54_06065 [Pseudomonadota bacterium]